MQKTKKIKDMSYEERRAYFNERNAVYRQNPVVRWRNNLYSKKSSRKYYEKHKDNPEFKKKNAERLKKHRQKNKETRRKYEFEHRQELKLVEILGCGIKEAKRLTGRVYFVPSYHFGISNYPEYKGGIK
jgi:hypothetical protein